MALVRIEQLPFDPEREVAVLREGKADIGAVVTFAGYCRNEGETLDGLEIEHFPGMAEAEIERIAAEAERRWPLIGLLAIHRAGIVRPGELIVFVAAASVHRAAAFAAADFLMDFLKTEAPFWKRELRRDGDAIASGRDGWVDAKSSDSERLGRWASERVDGAARE